MMETRRIGLLWASVLLCVILVSSDAAPFARQSHAESFLSQRQPCLPQQQQHTCISLEEIKNRNEGVVTSTSLSLLKDLRGGAEVDDEISMDTSSSSIIMSKIRNIIRSVLKIGEKKAPSLTKTLRSILKSLEDFLGVELLPPKATKRKKGGKKNKAAKKSKQAAAVAEEESDDESDEKVAKEKKKGKTAKAAASKTKPTATTAQHLNQKLTSKNPNYRIQKELKEFIKDPPPNLSVKVGKNIRIWIVTMVGAENTIYEGEVYKLRISFPPSYPTMPPSVYFLPPNIP